MTTLTNSSKRKIVGYWLLLGVAMIMIQVLLGGITRLTGSGLSMTEWEPIMGFLPPTNDAAWQKAFAGYQEIAQYKYINNHFTLDDFKFIFFWEWFHRVWARSLGVVFAIPFIFFLIKKYFEKDMILPLVVLFILGGFQGFIGWYMVKSGLDNSSLFYVSHIRLAVHFISALVLLCYALWFAMKLLIPEEKRFFNPTIKNSVLGIISLLTIQLFYGAFLAGMHGAGAAPTWPKMNGFWIPPLNGEGGWINNPINVQFVHRTIAYLLLIFILVLFFKIRSRTKTTNFLMLKKANGWMLGLISLQVYLGIITVISSPFIITGQFGAYEALAQTHQLVAMCLLMSLFVIFYLVSKREVKS